MGGLGDQESTQDAEVVEGMQMERFRGAGARREIIGEDKKGTNCRRDGN